jgi:hypothetical protein
MGTNPAPAAGGRADAPYGTLVFALICFTAVAASFVYLLASVAAQGNPNADKTLGSSFLGLLFTAIWTKRLWSQVATIEPESNPTFRQEHRAFAFKTGIIMAIVLLIAAVAGAKSGIHASRVASFKQLTDSISALGAKTAPTKQKFAALLGSDPPTIPEYVQRCNELERVNNDYETALQQMDALLGQLEQLARNDPGMFASVPGFLASVTTMRSVLAKDKESVMLVRREVSYAKQLPALSASDQVKLYRTTIRPIRDQQSRIGQEEIEILRYAKARGIKLPEQMYSQLGIE